MAKITNLANKYPIRHLSLRVPWHDNNWNGTVCQSPSSNVDCRILRRIYEDKDDEYEDGISGERIDKLIEEGKPCPSCVTERGTFMADFNFTRMTNHPYHVTSPQTHGHFKDTKIEHPAYSAIALPFRWMLSENAPEIAAHYNIDFDSGREYQLPFKTNWVQEVENQRALLDTFFSFIYPEKSLCFFYAKRVPFIEENRRVIIGVGRIKTIGQPIEYNYSEPGEIRSLIWERIITHSIRPDFKDGFILPYKAIYEKLQNREINEPDKFVAFAPDENRIEFSYASEHISNDCAIKSLLIIKETLGNIKKDFVGSWDKCLQWIDKKLGEIWRLRGPYPGLGAALSAFGIEYSHFVAWEIFEKINENEDPWPIVESMLNSPNEVLSKFLSDKIGDTTCNKWKNIPDERKELLKLISRFDVSNDQAERYYVKEIREKDGLTIDDKELLKNPYLIYELDRFFPNPISFQTVDQGVFPPPIIQEKHPLPKPSLVNENNDFRRVRAVTIDMLENAAHLGDTLRSRSELALSIREVPIEPKCLVDEDTYNVIEKNFSNAIVKVVIRENEPAYQLERFATIGKMIKEMVTKRTQGKRHSIDDNWKEILNELLPNDINDDLEKGAREEKIVALKEIASSRFSVLVGPAGTGKTELIAALCKHKQIYDNGILLLAPTGKARVRMSQRVGKDDIKAYTIAQFLNQYGRFNGETQRYIISNNGRQYDGAKTVVIDEASMLDEEMLGALLKTLKGVERLVLVGDPRQLPPIGPGRPFVDIVSYLTPKDIEGKFPKVGIGFTELTISRRQLDKKDKQYLDLQFADWFSGKELKPGDDEIFEKMLKNKNLGRIRIEKWETEEELKDKLISILVGELQLKNDNDYNCFFSCFGAVLKNNYSYFNLGCGRNAHKWQILSPVHGRMFGTDAINFLIHKQFLSTNIAFAKDWQKGLIPKPMGVEEIVYGDKVMNTINHRRNGFPRDGALNYVANGEIGIAIGQFTSKGRPKYLNVEFSSQPDYTYGFTSRDFKEDGSSCLELAYALTIHKAQGSDFDLVFLILPDPCWVLSRELLYTAITRQKDRIIILHQGDFINLKRFSSSYYSNIANRLTNIFFSPNPKLVQEGNLQGKFFEDRLINITAKGEPVRSKSEVIIANQLFNHNIEYTYEKPFFGNDDIPKYPDFTIEDIHTGRTYFWEHCGLLYDPNYRKKWERKLSWYKKQGVIPYQEGLGDSRILITTCDTKKGGIDSKEVERIITEALCI